MTFLSVADWAVILLYLAAIIALGVWFSKDQRNARDYFLGSKNIPWWGIGLSIVAAETSALTIIGVPGMAYGSNLAFLQLIIGYVLARIILAIVMVPHYLKGEIYSPYQLFANAFGGATRQTAAGFFLISETLAAGVRVYVVCIPIQLMLGIDVLPAIIWFVVLSLLYTYVGGVKAVIWTDAAQLGLFLAGGIFTLWYILHLYDGGLAAVIDAGYRAGKLHWLNVFPASPGPITFSKAIHFLLEDPINLWMGIVGGTVMVMSSHGAEQLIVQRVLACKTVADGRKALALSAVVIFPLFLIFLLIGAMLWVFYQKYPMQIDIPQPRPGIQKFDYIYPIFMLTAVPPVLKGFLVVAILSAAMSSVSSALTSLASVSTMDFVKAWVGQGGALAQRGHGESSRSEEWFLRFSKLSTVFWAGALICVAYLSREVTFVLDAAFKLRGLTSGALLGGLLLAVLWKNGRGLPVIAGMLCSLAVMIVISPLVQANLPAAWPHLTVKIAFPWYTLIGTTVMLLVAGAVRLCSRGKHSVEAEKGVVRAPV